MRVTMFNAVKNVNNTVYIYVDSIGVFSGKVNNSPSEVFQISPCKDRTILSVKIILLQSVSIRLTFWHHPDCPPFPDIVCVQILLYWEDAPI